MTKQQAEMLTGALETGCVLADVAFWVCLAIIVGFLGALVFFGFLAAVLLSFVVFFL